MKKILIAAISVFALLVCCGCGNIKAEAPATNSELNTPEIMEPIHATITVAGDLVMHTSVVNQCHVEGNEYDFTPLFEDVEHYVKDSDLALCCFEGAFAESGYSGYPLFLVPDGLASNLKSVGFDLVATASNHALDGGKNGMVRTLDVLDNAGLDHVGTYRSQEERDKNHGVVVENVNGITIAFLDYTYGTNGIPSRGFEYGINLIYNDYMTSFNDVDYELLDADLEYAKSLDTDLIAVISHWGAEYIPTKQAAQEKLAEYWFSHGVDMIFGGHPHVPEPVELKQVTDENGNTKTGFICYCLGNLLANMKETDQKYDTLTAMVQLDISKNPATGETVINDAKTIPMAVIDTADLGITGANWRFRVWDLNTAITDYENGNDRGGIVTENLYNTIKQYRTDLEGIIGPTLITEATP